MRHARWVRVFAVVFGVWFAAALTEPAALHACPMHGAVDGGDRKSPATAVHHHGADERSSSSSAPRSHRQGCTCIGSCCAAAVTAIPSAVAVVIAETTTSSSTLVHGSPTAYRPSEPEHARPPSQGPPRSIA